MGEVSAVQGKASGAAISAGAETLSIDAQPLSADELRKMDAYWRACNYCCVGMLYLQANPLLREPLKAEHIKNRLLGHWGSDPGQNFTWVHLNRLIKKYSLDLIYLAGPGHGAPATLSNSYLEGVYSEIYPDKSQDVAGMQKFFKQFSFPGGIGSHCTPETPGSIHEGGELGYSLSHGFGAAFDNPDLIVAVVVGDGESETAADPASERIQDCEPDDSGAHSAGGVGDALQGAGLYALCGGGRRSGGDAPEDGLGDGALRSGDSRDSGWRQRSRTRESQHNPCASELADDYPAHAKGMDLPEGAGRAQAGRLVARAPDSDHRSGDESRAPEARGRVDAELSARRVVR
jgi:hypothetical protein